MRYTETAPTRRSLCLLTVLLFAALYLAHLHVHELRSYEALQAAIATEAARTGNHAATIVQGEQVHAFPLYPWLVTLCSGARRPTEWTTRLPSAVAVLGMALLSAHTAFRLGGMLAAVVAAGMVLVNVACLREGTQAGSDAVFALLMSAAWFWWFRLGREQKRWSAACVIAVICVLAATFQAGLRAVVYFYLPVLLMRRPLRGWRRMLLPAHFIALTVAAAVLITWLVLVPGQTLLPWATQSLQAAPWRTEGYLRHVLLFPLKCTGYLLPWVFLAWPTFCVAFRPLERDAVFARFLRTIVVALFLASWLLPDTSARALLALVPPLAVLTGSHYEIVIRRHYRQLNRLWRLINGAVLVLGGILLLGGMLHAAGVIVFVGLDGATHLLNMLLLTAVLAAAWQLARTGAARPFWLRFPVSLALLQMVLLTTAHQGQAWLHSETRETGQLLAQALPLDEPVYKATRYFLVRESFYIGHPVIRVAAPDRDLPPDKRRVYALADAKPPILPERKWEPCSPPINVLLRNRLRLEWRPGGRCLLRLHRTAVQRNMETDPVVVRMYCGELR